MRSHYYQRGRPGADLFLGACGGRFEAEDRCPFSARGISGRRLREAFPDLERSTRANVSRAVMYRPLTRRTQPSVAECLRDEAHVHFLRRLTERIREEGGRVIAVGRVAECLLARVGVVVDEAVPHPSGRNRKWHAWAESR